MVQDFFIPRPGLQNDRHVPKLIPIMIFVTVVSDKVLLRDVLPLLIVLVWHQN